MEILTAIADTGTAYEICTELSEYVSYGDISIAREAVRSVGRIALEVPDVPGICDRLLSFLDVSKPAVAAETLVIIKVSLDAHEGTPGCLHLLARGDLVTYFNSVCCRISYADIQSVLMNAYQLCQVSPPQISANLRHVQLSFGCWESMEKASR